MNAVNALRVSPNANACSVISLADFVDELTMDTRAYYGVERRAETRHALVVPVAATPVDLRGQPTGNLFQAVTRDISCLGMALLHTSSIADRHLRLEFCPSGSQGFRVVLEVLRCRPIGPFWEIAGKFVTDLDAEV